MKRIDFSRIKLEVEPGRFEVLDQRRDPMLEVMADDINTLVLDAAMGQFGHVRAGSHPFLFPVDDGDDAATLDPDAGEGAP